MTSPISKRKYDCLLPEERDPNEQESDVDEAQIDVKALLEPLSSSCIYRVS